MISDVQNGGLTFVSGGDYTQVVTGEAKQTYEVFFVYAKETTAQFYDVYVGKGLNFNDQTDFSPIRVDISGVTNLTTKALDYRKVSNVQWAQGKYDKGTGILSVTINFASAKDELKPTRANGLCQPQSFCKVDGNDCVSTVPVDDPLKTDRDSVCKWAVKDLDCPVATYTGTGTTKKFTGGRCFGFSFTLSDGFEPNDLHRRPQPDAFPVTTEGPGKPDWMTTFKTIAAGKAGARCTYTEVPNRNCLPTAEERRAP